MSLQEPCVLFVPGIRAKPEPELQAAQLRRCIEYSVSNAGGNEAEVKQLASAFELVGWSYSFYGVHADIEPDMPGIDRLLSGAGDPEEDRREALGFGSRFAAAMYAIGDRFPVLSSFFSTRRMETRVAEINRYFRSPENAGATARAFLHDALIEAWNNDRRVLLIGHSFGSVIAYDTLWELTHCERIPHKVDLFVSMGSPLTMRYIRRRLKGSKESGAGRYPANMNAWLNLAALGEVTALDRRMADCFADMLRLGLIDRIDDNLELLNRFRGPHGLNVHKCYGYFASDTVGRTLLDWYRGT